MNTIVDIPDHKFNLSLINMIRPVIGPVLPKETIQKTALITLQLGEKPTDLFTRTYLLGERTSYPESLKGEGIRKSWNARLLSTSPLFTTIKLLLNRRKKDFRFNIHQDIMFEGIDPGLEWILSKVGQPHFYLVPLLFLGYPLGFLVFQPSDNQEDRSANLATRLLSPLSQVMIFHVFHKISANLDNYLRQKSLENRIENYFQQYCYLIRKAILPARIKLNRESWVIMYPTEINSQHKLMIKWNEKQKVEFQLPNFSILEKKHLNLEQNLEAFQSFLRRSCSTFMQYCQVKINISEVQVLISELQDYRSVLGELVQFHKSQAKQIDKLTERINTGNTLEKQTENEFYKGATGWHIRFKGNVVKLKGNYNTGLSYLHRLLQYPGRKFYPNELELVYQPAKSQNTSVQLSESFYVEIEPRFANLNPEDETELLSTLKRLMAAKPGNFDSFEVHIYYLSQMLYIAHMLKEVASKAMYITFFKEISTELEEKIVVFERETTDKLYVRRVLKKSGIIRKPAEYKVQIRRLRQRVTRSIKNAIKMMDSELLQIYFQETVNIGVRTSYQPTEEKINWKLEIN